MLYVTSQSGELKVEWLEVDAGKRGAAFLENYQSPKVHP
jgi:hypothetical protein